MMVDCRKCGRRRSTQFMQEAVFRNFAGDEPAGVWQCGSSQSCRQARKQARKEAESTAAKEKLMMGPPSDFGDRVCHGCGVQSDREIVHSKSCPGVCVRETCYWHEAMNLEADSQWRYDNWDYPD